VSFQLVLEILQCQMTGLLLVVSVCSVVGLFCKSPVCSGRWSDTWWRILVHIARV